MGSVKKIDVPNVARKFPAQQGDEAGWYLRKVLVKEKPIKIQLNGGICKLDKPVPCSDNKELENNWTPKLCQNLVGDPGFQKEGYWLP